MIWDQPLPFCVQWKHLLLVPVAVHSWIALIQSIFTQNLGPTLTQGLWRFLPKRGYFFFQNIILSKSHFFAISLIRQIMTRAVQKLIFSKVEFGGEFSPASLNNLVGLNDPLCTVEHQNIPPRARFPLLRCFHITRYMNTARTLCYWLFHCLALVSESQTAEQAIQTSGKWGGGSTFWNVSDFQTFCSMAPFSITKI